MSEQESLAALELDIRRSLPLNKDPEAIAHHVAKWLHKDGYRKPRTITTLEELDALPPGSVILDPVGLSLHKNKFTGWNSSNGAKDIRAEMLEREALPATVLHDGGAS